MGETINGYSAGVGNTVNGVARSIPVGALCFSSTKYSDATLLIQITGGSARQLTKKPAEDTADGGESAGVEWAGKESTESD